MLPGTLRELVTIVLANSAIALALGAPRANADNTAPKTDAPSVAEPQSSRPYVQYGAALAAEIVANAGPACAGAGDPGNPTPCILGSGGGIAARAGWRPNETWYLGGAYEVSKQDPHGLYRLALLQQARAEMRRYLPTGHALSPFLLAGAGVGGYGNGWWPLGKVDTWGPSGTLGGGVELQLGGPVLVVSLAYRPMYLNSWYDSSTLYHASGVAHFVGLEAAIEAQDTL
jgi:hypothetical protein